MVVGWKANNDDLVKVSSGLFALQSIRSLCEGGGRARKAWEERLCCELWRPWRPKASEILVLRAKESEALAFAE